MLNFSPKIMKEEDIKQENLEEGLMSISKEFYIKEELLLPFSECDQVGPVNDFSKMEKSEMKTYSEMSTHIKQDPDEEMPQDLEEIYVKAEASSLPSELDNISQSEPASPGAQDLNIIQSEKAKELQSLYSEFRSDNLKKNTSEMLQCLQCDYTTAYSADLTVHSRKHIGEMLQCKHCDYTTTRYRNLTIHCRKHTVKIFNCQHCDYTAARSENLKNHVRKHNGEMLKCQYCNFTTAYFSHLKIHFRKHTDKRLQCQHCDYTTTHSRNLIMHSRKHTGVYKALYNSSVQ